MHKISFITLTIVFLSACVFILPAFAVEYAIGDEITLSGTNLNSEYTYLYIQGANVPLQDIPTSSGGYVSTANHGVSVDEVTNRWSVKFHLANRFDAGGYTIYASAVPLNTAGHYASVDNDVIVGKISLTLRGHSMSSATPTPVYIQTPVPVSTPVPTIIYTSAPTPFATQITPVPSAATPAPASPLSLIPVLGVFAGLIYLRCRK